MPKHGSFCIGLAPVYHKGPYLLLRSPKYATFKIDPPGSDRPIMAPFRNLAFTCSFLVCTCLSSTGIVYSRNGLSSIDF